MCFGSAAKLGLCHAPIESLRTKGKWDGEIYLLTDMPECFEEIGTSAAEKEKGKEKGRGNARIRGRRSVDNDGDSRLPEKLGEWRKHSFNSLSSPSFQEEAAKSGLVRAYHSVFNASILVFPKVKSEMERKEYKGKLFQTVPYDNILRMDADILVGRPLQPYLDRLTLVWRPLI